MEKKLYTHDLAALIVEQFEDLLESQGVILTSPEDDEKEEDNTACLYGSTYSDLLDGVEALLAETCEDHKIPYVADEFSGTI